MPIRWIPGPHCQVCKRGPAKLMNFKGHQGFVVFRREYVFSGVFCRDCALEAYAAARGVNLRGMWFSPSSLLFGSLRSLWDAAKLLELPPEIKDAPWVPHKIGCPYCQKSQWVLPGL